MPLALLGADPVARWDIAERLCGARARFLLIDGVGHDRKMLQRHTMEFFREVLDL